MTTLANYEKAALNLIAQMLKSFAHILREVADIEETSGKQLGEIAQQLLTPEKLANLHTNLPPDIYSEFIAALFKLASISSTIKDPLILSTADKRKISDDLLKIAESIEKTVKHIH